jgi:ubiquinone/menaquinone biosynthesis C-methylase UbiE
MRANYDDIAEFYDLSPIRRKVADPGLTDWLLTLSALPPEARVVADVGCGTGSQLVANREQHPTIPMVGVDLSNGMLRKAISKDRSVLWIHSRGECLPLADASIAYLTNQFSYHHLPESKDLFTEIHRVLRPGGRFVLTNIDPFQMVGRQFYRYFPEALDRDLKDFLPPDELGEQIKAAGFVELDTRLGEVPFETDLASFRKIAESRTDCSQLTAITDDAHREGLSRIDAELASASEPASFTNPFCTVTIVADKPVSHT